MTLRLLYRLYGGDLKGRPAFYNKRTALASFLRAAEFADADAVILADGPIPDDMRAMAAQRSRIVQLEGGPLGMRASYLAALRFPVDRGGTTTTSSTSVRTTTFIWNSRSSHCKLRQTRFPPLRILRSTHRRLEIPASARVYLTLCLLTGCSNRRHWSTVMVGSTYRAPPAPSVPGSVHCGPTSGSSGRA